MHETNYTYSQTQQANREKQLVSLLTTGHYEVQSLRLLINASAASTPDEDGDYLDDEGITLGWGSDRRAIVTATELLTNPS